MLRLHLVFKQVSDERVVLRLPYGFRAIFAAITLLLVYSMVSLSAYEVVPIILCAITFIAAVYKDTWFIDNEAKVFEHRSGLLFLFFPRRIPFDAIEELVLVNYREMPQQPENELSRGRRRYVPKSLATFALVLKEGKQITLEIRDNRHAGDLKGKAEELSEFCSIPFRMV